MSETSVEARTPNAPTTRTAVQVFVSNAWADREMAKRIANLIEAQGYLVWWERDLGAPESGAAHAAAHAPCVIALWSRASLSSRWVMEEAEAAAARGALLEAMLDPIGSPLERPARDPLNLTTWSGEAEDNPTWKALMARVRSLAGAPQGRPISKLPYAVVSGVGLAVAAALTAVLTAPSPFRLEAEAPESIQPADRGIGGAEASFAREPASAMDAALVITTPLQTAAEPLGEEEASGPAVLKVAQAPAASTPIATTDAVAISAPPEPREPLGPMP